MGELLNTIDELWKKLHPRSYWSFRKFIWNFNVREGYPPEYPEEYKNDKSS